MNKNNKKIKSDDDKKEMALIIKNKKAVNETST